MLCKPCPSTKIGFFFFLFSALPLLAAYFAQYVLHVQPCLLCLYQRVPFFIVLIVSIIVILLRRKWVRQVGAAICCIAIAMNAGIAFFHAGVEYEIFRNFTWCSTRTQIFEKTPKNIEDIRKQLVGDGARLTIVSCEETPMRFLGLSLSGWNCVYCIVCLALFILYNRHVQNNRDKTAR